jgi:hypothetical protein
MGNSRVIFVGAVSIILGLYSVGLQKAERAIGRVGEIHAYQMQAEEIAKGGVALAITKMGTSKPSALPTLSNLSIFGGTVSYVVDDAGLPSDEARITVQGIYKGHQVSRIAVVRLTSAVHTKKKKWSNWETVKVFTQYAQAEYANPYTTD